MNFDFPVETIREGRVNIIIPKLEAFKRGTWDYAPSRAPVFYNPLMRTCRDIAVIALKSYRAIINKEMNVSEPLTGCGVRGIRFAKEVEGINAVYINDINEKAYKLAKYNVQLNNLVGRVFVANEDANLFLSKHAAPKSRFDFIDVDPFGSPVQYIDSAVRALKDGGLIALTATDMAPLCGVYPKVALRKYGGLSLKTEYCHEIAIRLLAGCLAITAAKHNGGIKVLFSHSTNHYVRLYALIEYGAKKADKSLGNMGYLFHCFNCFYREAYLGMPVMMKGVKCSECGSPLNVAGPLWLGSIVDKKFCSLMEKNIQDFEYLNHDAVRMISLIKEEADAPITYYVVDKICDKFGIPIPPLKNVIKSITESGFIALRTHFHSRGIKTNAPISLIIKSVKDF
ncbi:MAG: tRNA (guanine(10)-N(2))-dimethyltransferase [Candidatus Bathyarchaeia archaeon]